MNAPEGPSPEPSPHGEPVADGELPAVTVKTTRRPGAARRRYKLVTRQRLKNLSAPLEVPGAELGEIPILGWIVFAVIAVVAVVVVGILLGGFLVALIEVVLLAVLAAGGSLWAWLRGHPKVAIMDVGDRRWVRPDGPQNGASEDAEAVMAGLDPSTLGYRPVDG